MLCNNDEPLVTLTIGDPVFLPTAFADLVGAVASLPTGFCLDPNGMEAINDQIVDCLTEGQMDAVERIAALVTLRRAATTNQTFSEWLETAEARRTSHSAAVASVMDNDPGWPRGARTHAELRDYVARDFPHVEEVLEIAWDQYLGLVLAPYGNAGTTHVGTQYATLITWQSGSSEIHPKTADGTSRYEAERHVQTYNDIEASSVGRPSAKGSKPRSSASVIRRGMAYGPWYKI